RLPLVSSLFPTRRSSDLDQTETGNNPRAPEAEVLDPGSRRGRAIGGHAAATPRPLRSGPSLRPGRLVLDGPRSAPVRDDVRDRDGFVHGLDERGTDAGHDHEDAQDSAVLPIHADAEDDVRVGAHRRRQPFDDLVRGPERETWARADVDERAIGPAVVDLEKRVA